MPFHQPKLLYRELDGLLGVAEREHEHGDVTARFLAALFGRFARDLRLASAAAYVERRGRLQRTFVIGSEESAYETELELTAAAATDLMERKVVISVDHPHGLCAGTRRSVALVQIEQPRERQLLVVELDEGWVREDLELALNAARSVLMARLLEERLGGTLREAAEIQRDLLPTSPPRFEGFDIAARSLPAEEVGGDFFDFRSLEEHSIALSIGDVSGHGLPAALVARDVVIALRMGVERELKITHTMHKLNRVIHASSASSSFVSLFFAELESNGNLFYVNAGHEPPIYFDRGVETALARGGPVIGPLADVRFKSHFLHVDRGSTLVFYTDGIVERRGDSGELFGLEGLKETVRGSLECSAAAIVERIFEAAQAHASAPWEDDASVVVVHRSP